jgi:hypothetical protein
VIEVALERSRGSVLDRIAQAFRQRDPYYDARWMPLNARRKGLNDILSALLKKGHPMECALQHFNEAKWLINYTDDWTRASAALDECETSLQDVDQPRIKQGADGSWGPCCHEWYRKLEPTIDALQEREAATDHLEPLAFMSFLQKPANVVGLLRALSISDIVATGRNLRDEQNALLTALGQLIFKDGLRKLLLCRPEHLKFTVSPELEETFTDYLWGLQQKQTGYWGPSYKFDDGIMTVPDLSFTFHIVHYYMDNTTRVAPNLDKKVATTLAMKHEIYPNGWLEKDGSFSDHNNYDVVTLFDCGWKAASWKQREVIRHEIQALLDWCLTRSLQDDHFGKETTIDGYYYGVRFLDRIGFWDKAKRFWLSDDISLPNGCPTPEKIRERLLEGFKTVDDGSEYCETIAQILTGQPPVPDACGRT